MSIKKLRATQEVYYASKTRRTGDEFDAHESEAKLLVGLGKAEYVETAKPAPKPAPQKLETAAVKADESNSKPDAMTMENSAEITEQRPRRRYLRRDMQAKE